MSSITGRLNSVSFSAGFERLHSCLPVGLVYICKGSLSFFVFLSVVMLVSGHVKVPINSLDHFHDQIQTSSCGYGTQIRNLSCVRHDNLEMDISMCPQEMTHHFQLSRSCLIACPGDCQLSEWTEWGPCHRPCSQQSLPG